MIRTSKFDMAEYLDTEELREGYLDFVSEEGTPEEILKAISDVARARNGEDRTRGGNHARRALQGAFARRQPRVRHGLQNPQRDWMLAHAFPETHAK